MKPRVDCSGEMFWRWSILIDNIVIDWRVYRWCKCDCGTYRLIRNDQRSKSCGCFSRDEMAARIGERHPNWKGGLQNKGSEAWAKNIIRVGANTAKEKGYAAPNITVAEMVALYAAFDGACRICRKLITDENKHDICVDHCHVTGSIRGFLCKHCNGCVGWWEIHRAAIEKYLKDTAITATLHSIAV